MTESEGGFQVVKKRNYKDHHKDHHKDHKEHKDHTEKGTQRPKLSFKELLFERNNLKKYQHSPKVDLRERESTFVVRMELAGLTSNDVTVQVRDSQFLLVSGTKTNVNTQDSDNVVYSECNYGNFMRRVKLPKTVNKNSLHFYLENGVLYITVEQLEKDTTTTTTTTTTLETVPENTVLDFDSVEPTQNWADEM